MKIVLGTILAAYDLTLAQAPARVTRRAITFWPEHGTRITVSRARARSRRSNGAELPVSQLH
jgi:cytochrome P450